VYDVSDEALLSLFFYFRIPRLFIFFFFALYHGRVNVLLIINPSILNIYLLLLCSFHRSDFIDCRYEACNAPFSTFRGCLQQEPRVAIVAHTCRSNPPSRRSLSFATSKPSFPTSLDNTTATNSPSTTNLTSTLKELISKARNSTLTRSSESALSQLHCCQAECPACDSDVQSSFHLL
jgi:hypothetical protein